MTPRQLVVPGLLLVGSPTHAPSRPNMLCMHAVQATAWTTSPWPTQPVSWTSSTPLGRTGGPGAAWPGLARPGVTRRRQHSRGLLQQQDVQRGLGQDPDRGLGGWGPNTQADGMAAPNPGRRGWRGARVGEHGWFLASRRLQHAAASCPCRLQRFLCAADGSPLMPPPPCPAPPRPARPLLQKPRAGEPAGHHRDGTLPGVAGAAWR